MHTISTVSAGGNGIHLGEPVATGFCEQHGGHDGDHEGDLDKLGNHVCADGERRWHADQHICADQLKCCGAQADGGEQHPEPLRQFHRGGEHLFFAAQIFSAYAEQRGAYHRQRDESRNGYRLRAAVQYEVDRDGEERALGKSIERAVRRQGAEQGGSTHEQHGGADACEHAAGVEQHGEREAGDGCAQHFATGVADEKRAHGRHKAANERGPVLYHPFGETVGEQRDEQQRDEACQQVHEHEVLGDVAVVGLVQPKRSGERDGVPRDPAAQAQIRQAGRLPVDGRKRVREPFGNARGRFFLHALVLRRIVLLTDCHIPPILD